jgi:hypothetical protein
MHFEGPKGMRVAAAAWCLADIDAGRALLNDLLVADLFRVTRRG